MKTATIVMYHFVRDLKKSAYPGIKGLETSQFIQQLDYFAKYYTFVTMQDCIRAVDQNDDDFPTNALLLTFDDGYLDHFETVMPILKKRNIKGCFYVPVKAAQHQEVLDVNKIHFVLAAVPDLSKLTDEFNQYLDEYRSTHQLHDSDYYFRKLAQPGRYDPPEVMYIKRMLQKEIPGVPRMLILNRLFRKYVTADETGFASELYLGQTQLKTMIEEGMHVGAHGYKHCWLNFLSENEQKEEIDASLKFLKKLGASLAEWTMCYPHGAYNDSLINILREKQCRLALTINVGIASVSRENALILPRLNTNDFPKIGTAAPNDWTQKVTEFIPT